MGIQSPFLAGITTKVPLEGATAQDYKTSVFSMRLCFPGHPKNRCTQMFKHAFLNKSRIHYVQFQEPFTLGELITIGASDQHPQAPRPRGDQPVIMDFREVNLARFTKSEIQRHIMQKSVLSSDADHTPCAYVVASNASRAAVRTALIYGGVAGTNSESTSFIAESISSAAKWVSRMSGAFLDDILAELDSAQQASPGV